MWLLNEDMIIVVVINNLSHCNLTQQKILGLQKDSKLLQASVLALSALPAEL